MEALVIERSLVVKAKQQRVWQIQLKNIDEYLRTHLD